MSTDDSASRYSRRYELQLRRLCTQNAPPYSATMRHAERNASLHYSSVDETLLSNEQ